MICKATKCLEPLPKRSQKPDLTMFLRLMESRQWPVATAAALAGYNSPRLLIRHLAKHCVRLATLCTVLIGAELALSVIVGLLLYLLLS